MQNQYVSPNLQITDLKITRDIDSIFIYDKIFISFVSGKSNYHNSSSQRSVGTADIMKQTRYVLEINKWDFSSEA